MQRDDWSEQPDGSRARHENGIRISRIEHLVTWKDEQAGEVVVMGVDARALFTLVFAAGAALCAVAGALLGPLLAVQVGMGENILILAFVVVTIGGIGSVRGALIGALLVGLVDTIGRAFLPLLFRQIFPTVVASEAGPAVASMLIYMLMAAVLYWRPSGLFPARG